MQNRVGGAAEGHVDSDGVFHALPGDDVERTDVLAQELHDTHAGVLGQTQAGGVDGRNGAVAGQGHADGLGKAVHGVGREHAGAGTAAGAGALFHLLEFFGVESAGLVAAHSLEHGDKVSVLSVRRVAGKHGAAGDEDGGQVQAHHGHEHAGDGFVAVGDEDEAVERVGAGHDFAAVGDVVPGGQGEAHAFMVHGDTVAHGDGGKFKRSAAGHADAGLDRFGDLIEVHVAGNHLAGGVDDADDGAVDFFLCQAERVEQRPVGGFFEPLFHE